MYQSFHTGCARLREFFSLSEVQRCADSTSLSIRSKSGLQVIVLRQRRRNSSLTVGRRKNKSMSELQLLFRLYESIDHLYIHTPSLGLSARILLHNITSRSRAQSPARHARQPMEKSYKKRDGSGFRLSDATSMNKVVPLKEKERERERRPRHDTEDRIGKSRRI